MDLSGRKITVMGLGVHGGGLHAARYLTTHGARVTVTDLRDERTLRHSVEQLPEGVRLVLGRHEEEDFRSCDLVVKNPAVPRSAPYLQYAPAITTDIALFLATWATRSDRGPLIVFTGTKGKSSTCCAATYIARGHYPATRLGGNITVSPLQYCDQIEAGAPVVLELSSFQLGDIAFCRTTNAGDDARLPAELPRELFFPTIPADVAGITNIFTDHQDYYHSMERYVEDKREIYRHLPPHATFLVGGDGAWDHSFTSEVERLNGGVTIIDLKTPHDDLLPERLSVAGAHGRRNVHFAALAARAIGVPHDVIRNRSKSFPGVPHRLEVTATTPYARYINDSAATIPEATRAAVDAFREPIVLIAGGSDKGLDPTPIVEAAREATHRGGGVILLDGSATTALRSLLSREGIAYEGVYSSLEGAVARATDLCRKLLVPREGGVPLPVILLSPGCASFGMFRNEFDRGDQFRALSQRYLDPSTR